MRNYLIKKKYVTDPGYFSEIINFNGSMVAREAIVW
jgi:hypothetical protein